MREELLALLADPASEAEIVPYVDYSNDKPLDQWRALNRSKQWSAYYLLKDGVRVDSHLARCPRTAALLEAAPLADVPGHAPTAFFSMLQPRTRIPPHTRRHQHAPRLPRAARASPRLRVSGGLRDADMGTWKSMGVRRYNRA